MEWTGEEKKTVCCSSPFLYELESSESPEKLDHFQTITIAMTTIDPATQQAWHSTLTVFEPTGQNELKRYYQKQKNTTVSSPVCVRE